LLIVVVEKLKQIIAVKYFKKNLMKKRFLLPFVAITLSACSVIQKNTTELLLEEVLVETTQIAQRDFYHESPERVTDLLHTKLNVSFDWNKKHLLGTAYLDLKPYFTAQNSLTLDAKGFDIHQIALVKKNGDKLNLDYTYDDKQIVIQLDREYTRNETYTLFIDYTAKPDDLTLEGGDAITDAKGLYFINPDHTEDKPQQIWTQGETESSSCWFPCIDKPNERCTQEIAITVQEKYTTLSNGLLIKSTDNADGTRTDVWKQKLEHAPYLFMMAVGEFSITKDKWRDLEVNYYVEPEQEKHAQRIFGKTPEMMEFYSTLLDFDYPWEKYSQIIVRDYVSGAMENTSAVIHGEFVYSDEREFIDDPNEMIIAHELFHHWFGDWVTCESWPNLPLNEGFATYGEYLWMEGKYSADEAAYYIHQDLKQYLNESRSKQVDHIRFDNENPNNMFDSHSYAKGGRILHMLRYAIGDDAFFSGLAYYLTEYANQAVEVHQLRLAMEHISGQDLNWFFNQWFLASGHATISVDQKINENRVSLIISQNQSLETTPLYKLPLAIDIYINGEVQRHLIELNKQEEVFEFETSAAADLIVFDADHYLLADISFEKSDQQWVYQLENSPHYYDRMEALDSLANSENFASLSRAVQIGLNDDFWAINILALEYFENVDPRTQGTLEAQLIKMAKSHPKSDVRAAAINNLSLVFDQNENMASRSHTDLYTAAATDLSYIVAGDALKALAFVQLTHAYNIAIKELPSSKKALRDAVFYVISKNAKPSDAKLIIDEFNQTEGYHLIDATQNLLLFLQEQKMADCIAPLKDIYTRCSNLKTWYHRFYILEMMNRQLSVMNGEFKEEVHLIFKKLVEQEEDPRVLKYLGMQK